MLRAPTCINLLTCQQLVYIIQVVQVTFCFMFIAIYGLSRLRSPCRRVRVNAGLQTHARTGMKAGYGAVH